jgi:hypothetical protein
MTVNLNQVALARDLASAGVTVISGLHQGLDGIAHHGGLPGRDCRVGEAVADPLSRLPERKRDQANKIEKREYIDNAAKRAQEDRPHRRRATIDVDDAKRHRALAERLPGAQLENEVIREA